MAKTTNTEQRAELNNATLKNLASLRAAMQAESIKLVKQTELEQYALDVAAGRAAPATPIDVFYKGMVQRYADTQTLAVVEKLAEVHTNLDDFKAALKMARECEAIPVDEVRAMITIALVKHKNAYRHESQFNATTGKAVAKDANGKPSALYMAVRRLLEDTAPDSQKKTAPAAKPEKTTAEKLEKFIQKESQAATIAALVALLGKAALLEAIDAVKLPKAAKA